MGAENLCHLCRPVLWTPAPRSRGWQVLAWPDVRPDVTQELHGRLKRKPARMLTFPTQPTVLRRRPCLRTSRTGRLILEAARALTAAGQTPFARISVYQWIWRRYSQADHTRPSLDPTFQGMTKNAAGGPPAHAEHRSSAPTAAATYWPNSPPSHPPFGADEARSASTSIDVRNAHAARDDR